MYVLPWICVKWNSYKILFYIQVDWIPNKVSNVVFQYKAYEAVIEGNSVKEVIYIYAEINF